MRAENGHLVIGAVTRDRDVELWMEARECCPILTEALRRVGYVEIRNRGITSEVVPAAIARASSRSQVERV